VDFCLYAPMHLYALHKEDFTLTLSDNHKLVISYYRGQEFKLFILIQTLKQIQISCQLLLHTDRSAPKEEPPPQVGVAN